jgi:hypothetical protein
MSKKSALPLVLALLMPPVFADPAQIVGTWKNQRDGELLIFRHNGELWSCYESAAGGIGSRGVWRETAPGRFQVQFLYTDKSDCFSMGRYEKRLKAEIVGMALIDHGTLAVHTSGEGPAETYRRDRRFR